MNDESLDEYNYVYCKICGIRKVFLKGHLRVSHNLTVDEYTSRFPGSLTVAPSYTKRKSKIMTERNYKDWQDPKYREHIHQVLRDNAPTRTKGWHEGSRKYFEEHPEERIRIATMGGRAHISQHGQKFLTEGKLNSELFHNMKSKQLHDMLVELHKNPDWESKLIDAAIASHNGLKEYTLYSGDTVKLRSSWEFLLYEFLVMNNIEFEYEPFAIRYSFDGGLHRYYPDFFIPQRNLVIEVKPDCFLDDKYESKKQATIDQGYLFLHIGDAEITHLNEILPLVQSA